MAWEKNHGTTKRGKEGLIDGDRKMARAEGTKRASVMETGHGRKREEPGRVEKGSVGKRMEPRKQEERGLFQGKEKKSSF